MQFITLLPPRDRTVFVIEHKKRPGWFLYELTTEHTDGPTAIWFPHLITALTFDSEQQVEEFKSIYINPRPVNIIRVSPQLS